MHPPLHFQNTVDLITTPREVFEHLSRPESYIGLSPLVVAVHDQRHDFGLVRYTAIERFKLVGPFHYDNPIEVSLVADDTHASHLEVSGDVVSSASVRVQYKYTITPRNVGVDGCRLIDTITLYAPWLLRRFAGHWARSVQLQRGRILVERLSRRPVREVNL